MPYGALQVTSKTDDGGIAYAKQVAHDARARFGVVLKLLEVVRGLVGEDVSVGDKEDARFESVAV